MAELIRRVAEERAGDVALIDERGETSWGDLNDRVNRLISGLRRLGDRMMFMRFWRRGAASEEAA